MRNTLVNWSSAEGCQARQGPEALVLLTAAEGMGLVQHGEEEASQGPDSCLLASARSLWRRWTQALHGAACWEDKR